MHRKLLLFFGLFLLVPRLSFTQPVIQPNIEGEIRFNDTPVNQSTELEFTVLGGPQGNWLFLIGFEDDSAFFAEPAFFEIGPRQAVEVVLRFTPREAREYRSNLIAFAFLEDQDPREWQATAIGRGIGDEDPPEISVEPLSLNLVVEDEDDLPNQNITIGNIGEASLEFEFADPEVDWLTISPDEGELEQDEEIEVTVSVNEEFPPNNGNYQTELIIESNDPEAEQVAIRVVLTVDIPGEFPQNIELARGWNMISSARIFANQFVDDEGPDVRLILNEIIDNVIIIKDDHGAFSSPIHNFWGIPEWTTGEGYLIKVTEDVELTLLGEIIESMTEISLEPGWNMVAYYPDYSLPMGDAFNQLVFEEVLIIAKNGDGEFYYPARDLGYDVEIQQGEGLMLKVTEACTLWYPLIPDRELTNNAPSGGNVQHFPKPMNTGNNMSVVIEDLHGIVVQPNAEIACVTTEGYFSGAITLDTPKPWGMAVWGDDPTTEGIDGFVPDEQLTFYYWDPDTRNEFKLYFANRNDGEIVYKNDALVVLGMTLGVESEESVPTEFAFLQPYPNPFNSRTQIRFGLPTEQEILLSVFDINGRLVKEVVDSRFNAGYHSVDISGEGLTSGIYFLRVKSESFNRFVKLNFIQ